jgi:hypothetical protein
MLTVRHGMQQTVLTWQDNNANFQLVRDAQATAVAQQDEWAVDTLPNSHCKSMRTTSSPQVPEVCRAPACLRPAPNFLTTPTTPKDLHVAAAAATRNAFEITLLWLPARQCTQHLQASWLCMACTHSKHRSTASATEQLRVAQGTFRTLTATRLQLPHQPQSCV